MKKESETAIYAGASFTVSPSISMTFEKRSKFQQLLEENEIILNNINFDKQSGNLIGIRNPPMSLDVRLLNPAPAISQLTIVAPQMGGRSIDYIGKEMCDIGEAFMKVWPQKQVISSDATVRNLYESSSEHAFQELWENFLHQTTDNLSAFQRPVLGGGLRFVLPPIPPNEPQIEIKIESFLQDSHKFFIEVQCIWVQPQLMTLDPDNRIQIVDDYLRNQVLNFISKGAS
jgi:hypothetical protein